MSADRGRKSALKDIQRVRSRDADVVDEREMNHIFTVPSRSSAAGRLEHLILSVPKPHPSRMRAHRHSELGRHQQDRQYLIDPGEPTRVDLTDVDGLGLEELFEYHAVVRVLSCCDTNADVLEPAADRGVTEDVIGSRRLFDEPSESGMNFSRCGRRFGSKRSTVCIQRAV